MISLGALLGRSWGVPGSSWCRVGSLPGRPGALLGVIWGSRGASFGGFLVSFEGCMAKSRKHRKSLVFFNVFSRFFKVPGSQNRSKIVPKSLRRGSWTPGWPQEGAKSDLGGSGIALEGFREAWNASWEANKADKFPGTRLPWAPLWAPAGLETDRRGGVGELGRRLY